MAVPYHITIDLKQDWNLPFKLPRVTQNDTDIEFIITIKDGGEEVDIAEHYSTITLTSQRRDSKAFYVLGTVNIENNELHFVLGSREVELTGRVAASVQLYSVDGRQSTAHFAYSVRQDLSARMVPTEKEATLIETVLIDGPKEIARAKKAADDANKARTDLTGAVGNALESLGTDKAAALAEVSTAVTEANTARDGANEAAGRANQSADDTDRVRAETAAEREATEQVRQNTEAERGSAAAEREATEAVRSSVEELIPQTEQARDGALAATADAHDAAEKARDVTDGSGAIYGVIGLKSTGELTRTNASIGKVANVGVDDELVRNDFDNAQIYKEIVDVTDEIGNEFVWIPKFYIRKVDTPVYFSRQVSKTKYAGYYLPKCFWDFENGVELDGVLVGKYRASLSADNKLESKPDRYPLVSRNIVQFREYAQANNTDGLSGYQQHDIHVQDVIETLFVVEFATLHSQAVMSGFTSGQYATGHLATLAEAQTNRFVMAASNTSGFHVGQSIGIGTSRGGNQITDYREITAIESVDEENSAIVFDGDPVDVAVGNFIYNTAFKTGFSRNVAASSGSPVSNTDGRWGCSYRGIESPWGDVYTWVDGVNINDHQTWVAEDARDYASNLFTAPYKKLGYVNSQDDGYTKVLGFDANAPFAQFPVTVGASSGTFYADYYYQAAGTRVAAVGGHWYLGAFAGLFFWHLTISSGPASLLRGGRLLKKIS